MSGKDLLKISTIAGSAAIAAIALAYFFDPTIAANIAVGYLGALLVLTGSMIGYMRMVRMRLEEGLAIPDDDRDVIDKQEDPYDLYSETEQQEVAQTFKEALREEKMRLKRNRRSFFEVLRDSKPALSLYRLGAYAYVVIGFLILKRHETLHIGWFLGSVAAGIVAVLGMLFVKSRTEK